MSNGTFFIMILAFACIVSGFVLDVIMFMKITLIVIGLYYVYLAIDNEISQESEEIDEETFSN